MSGYIIDPSWFYWIKVCDAVRMVLLVLAIVGTIACIMGLPIYYTDAVYDNDDKKRFRRIATQLIVSTAIGWLLVIFIPSKDTLIEMQIARYATYDNAQWTVESIKSAVDYIIDAIKSLK